MVLTLYLYLYPHTKQFICSVVPTLYLYLYLHTQNNLFIVWFQPYIYIYIPTHMHTKLPSYSVVPEHASY